MGNGVREDAPLLRETSKNPEIREFRNPENPEIRKSGNPEIRKSGNPEINLELAETHFRYTTIIGLCQKSAINLPELYQNYDINMPE